MLPPPAALPWYHPRRVLDDLVALVALVALATAYAASALLGRADAGSPSGEPEAAPLPDAEEEEEEEEAWAEAREAMHPPGAIGYATLPVRATGWPAARSSDHLPPTSPTSPTSSPAATSPSPLDRPLLPRREDATFEMYHEVYPPGGDCLHDASARAKAPCALLLNPTGGSALSWILSGAAKHFQSRGFRVVLCDLRGQGRTGAPPPGPYAVRTLALDVRALIRALELERVHAVGFSLGAAVALQLAALDAEGESRAEEALASDRKPKPKPKPTPDRPEEERKALSTTKKKRPKKPRVDRRVLGAVKRWLVAVARGGESGDAESSSSPPSPHPRDGALLSSATLFGFTANLLADKTFPRRALVRFFASERFVRAVGVRAFGRLMASATRFNWSAIDDGGGYPVAATEPPTRFRALDSETLMKIQLRNFLDGYAWCVASWAGFDARDALPKIQTPTMFVHAAGEDRAGHAGWTKKRDAERMPRGRFVDVPGPYSHAMPYEATKTFVELAADFIDEVEARARPG